MPNSKPCSVPGCGRIPPALRRGMCGMHYKRFMDGKPLEDPVQERRPRGLGLAESFRRRMGTPPTDGSCWEWVGSRHPRGHGYIGHGGRILYTHRVAYEVFVGPIPDGMLVLHNPEICNNPPCCNPDHLRIGTHAENMADMDIADTRPRGEQASGAKLTDLAVREIREIYGAGGTSQEELGARYGVSQMVVSRIVRGLIWRHVK